MILHVADSSEISAARRATGELTRKIGLDEERSGRAALLVTEMATNLLKHADGGEIVIERFADGAGGAGLEILSLDKGRGIADVSRALEDGFSTAGSLGSGLGAIRRQADGFAIFSRPGLGTAILARLFDTKGQARSTDQSNDLVVGGVTDPYPGETQSGDAWVYAPSTRGHTLLTVDGSGHGEQAAQAADIAVAAFHANIDDDCPRLVEKIHRALAPTRGAAVAVARVDAREKLVRFLGVGNITAATLFNDGTVRRMVSHNGTAGHIAPRIREFTYPFSGTVTIVLHSDGLSAKWDLATYPGLAANHPSLIAGILFRDHRRGRDDASVAVMRVAAARAPA
jgi:anti-sigma regulatory factor (Ser/Thr protein kinase)